MKNLFKKLFISFLLLIPLNYLEAQDTTKSLAFKNNKPDRKRSFFYQPDLSYQIWQQFNLIKEANTGNPLAQHELGIRYLLGEGVQADTLQGAYWMQKAAAQNLTFASFNYGILLLNGWGVKWDPFKAFEYFNKAAEDGMPQAQYIIGLFYTDNLIVKRDWSKAYRWIEKSASANYDPAKKILNELADKIPAASLDTVNSKILNDSGKTGEEYSQEDDNALSSSLGLVFIDFDTITDSIQDITDKMLIEDLLLIENEELKSIISDSSGSLKITTLNNDSLNIPMILKFAEAGSPEALTLIGKLYQDGIYFSKDFLNAASYYIRAARYDSPTAPLLLWEMEKENNFYAELKNLIDKNDPGAMYIWYGLYSFGFDNQISESDAFNLINKAASLKYLPAIIELGLLYYTGRFAIQDRQKALAIWEEAKILGSIEAEVRITAARIFDDNSLMEKDFKRLISIVNEGSLFAQFLIAYCYDRGIRVNQDRAEAVKYFRFAAQRGSRFAYEELKRIYDEIRPQDDKFFIN